MTQLDIGTTLRWDGAHVTLLVQYNGSERTVYQRYVPEGTDPAPALDEAAGALKAYARSMWARIKEDS